MAGKSSGVVNPSSLTLFGERDDLRRASVEVVEVHRLRRGGPGARRSYILFTIRVSKKITVILGPGQRLHDNFFGKTVRDVGLVPQAQLGEDLPLDGLETESVRLGVLVDAVGAGRLAALLERVLQLADVDVVVGSAVPQPLAVRRRQRAAQQVEAGQGEGPPAAAPMCLPPARRHLAATHYLGSRGEVLGVAPGAPPPPQVPPPVLHIASQDGIVGH
jgi:hypothetical protein